MGDWGSLQGGHLARTWGLSSDKPVISGHRPALGIQRRPVWAAGPDPGLSQDGGRTEKTE